MTDEITSMIGLALGLGIGLFTLKTLENLSPQHKTEIEKILHLSKKTSPTTFLLVVRDSNLTKAKNTLKRSGFTIMDEIKVPEQRVTNIYFRERIRR